MACFSEDTITDLLAGRLRLEGDVEEHLAGCAFCARLLGLASPTAAGVADVVPAAAPGEPRKQSRPGAGVRPVLEPGALLNDTYQVCRLIGRGGMGEVYEVTHARLAGRYALKVLRADFSDDHELATRFQREAEISSALHHPNIVQVIDFDRTSDGCFYLAMEYLEGMDLARLLRREGRLPLDRVMRLAGQIASALAAAHRRGVIHRDLKPENVFIVEDESGAEERVKLMDFGLSKWSDTSLESSAALSRDKALIGTPRYMAPEQALGRNREISAATDQFALAALVYEMIAGAPAFTAPTVAQVLYAIVYEQPRDLGQLRSDLPPGLAEAIGRGLAKAPADRFPSVVDFYQSLTDPPAVSPAGPPPARRMPRAPIALALLITLVVSAVAWRGGIQRPRAIATERPVPPTAPPPAAVSLPVPALSSPVAHPSAPAAPAGLLPVGHQVPDPRPRRPRRPPAEAPRAADEGPRSAVLVPPHAADEQPPRSPPARADAAMPARELDLIDDL